jgi:hypothetical protein
MARRIKARDILLQRDRRLSQNEITCVLHASNTSVSDTLVWKA